MVLLIERELLVELESSTEPGPLVAMHWQAALQLQFEMRLQAVMQLMAEIGLLVALVALVTELGRGLEHILIASETS